MQNDSKCPLVPLEVAYPTSAARVLSLVGRRLRLDQRWHSLRVASRVSKAWREAFLPHIFYKATLSYPDEYEKWNKIFTAIPAVPRLCLYHVSFDPTKRAVSVMIDHMIKTHDTKSNTRMDELAANAKSASVDPLVNPFPILFGVRSLKYAATLSNPVYVIPQTIHYLSHFPNLERLELCCQFASIREVEHFFAALPPLKHIHFQETMVMKLARTRGSSKARCDFSKLQSLRITELQSHNPDGGDWVIDLLLFRPRLSPKSLQILWIEDWLSDSAMERILQAVSATLTELWMRPGVVDFDVRKSESLPD